MLLFFILFVLVMKKKMLQEEVKSRNLDNVRFIDAVPKKEVFKYILASDVGLSVLKNVETFKTIYSNKTFDYMSCKKPILMAIDGVSRELVEEAQAGFFVQPENPNDFATKIELFLNDRSLISSQGERGYRYAKQHFDREALAQTYIEKLQTFHVSKSN
jgi:glycosyltransferase involved in cell wall biosynthesis